MKLAMRRQRVRNAAVAAAAGVHVKTVSQWLSDRQQPENGALAAVATLLAVPEAWLRYGDEAGLIVREETREPFTVNPSFKKRLPPRIYERVHGYLSRMEAGGCSAEEIEWAERLLSDDTFAQLHKGGARERSEEDQITDMDAAWEFVRRMIREHEGKDL